MEYVNFEAVVASNNEVGSKDEVSDADFLESFIDDKTEVEKNRKYYRNFKNITKPVDETLAEEFDESMCEIENFDEVSNFCESFEEEGQIDEFKDVEKRISLKKRFTQSPQMVKKKQSILSSMLYYLHLGLMFLKNLMFALKMN